MYIFVTNIKNVIRQTLPFAIEYRPFFFYAGDTYPRFDTFYKNWIHNHLRVLEYRIP